MMRVLAAAAALLLLLTSCASPQPQEHAPPQPPPTLEQPSIAVQTSPASPKTGTVAPAESGRIEIMVGDKERSFVLSVPEGYSDKQQWPVIFAFHGWGQTAQSMRSFSQFDRASAIIVYGEGVDDAWSPAPYAKTTMEEDLAYAQTALTGLKENYAVDPERIFSVGVSNGGGFASLLGCRMPEEFSAVATVSAAYYRTRDDGCEDSPQAHLNIHGTSDKVIDYHGGRSNGSTYHSVQDVLSAAADRNRCEQGATLDPASTQVVEYEWQECAEPVVHLRIGGGGHQWPGGNMDTTVVVPDGYATYRILEFLGIDWRV